MLMLKHSYWSISLLLLGLAAIAGAVTFQRLSPSHVVLTARLYELRVNATSVSMHMRRRATGLIRENDYLEYKFQAWSDDMWWSLSPNNGTAECTRTTTVSQNFTGPFTVEYVRHRLQSFISLAVYFSFVSFSLSAQLLH
jgi:hypothetical protein